MAEKVTFINHLWPTHAQHLFQSSYYITRLCKLSIQLKDQKASLVLIFSTHEIRPGGTSIKIMTGMLSDIMKRSPKIGGVGWNFVHP